MSKTPYLTIPHVKSELRYDRNFIKLAVCELRFPTILELEQNAPVALQKALRRKYPHYDIEKTVHLEPSTEADHSTRYIFRSNTRDWSVSVRSHAIALETSAYTDFDDFVGRLEFLLKQSADLIDSDFFTRIGLRYVNLVPIEGGEVAGWINHDLIAPIEKGIFGPVQLSNSEVRGKTEFGSYTFRHGITGLKEPSNNAVDLYALDFDFYCENAECKEAVNLIKSFKKDIFSFFYWCLGGKAKGALGKGTPKSDINDESV